MLRLGIIASHGGSNVQAILDACGNGTIKATPAVVISNNSTSGALARARTAGVATLHLSSATHRDHDALDEAMLNALTQHDVGLVVLAGYMKRLGPRTVDFYRGRALNIHPALLPRHGGPGLYGDRVHQAVLDAGETETGATVHMVDEEYDHGPMLAQTRVPVVEGDTVESLRERVLSAEHALYIETIRRIADGTLAGRTVKVGD